MMDSSDHIVPVEEIWEAFRPTLTDACGLPEEEEEFIRNAFCKCISLAVSIALAHVDREVVARIAAEQRQSRGPAVLFEKDEDGNIVARRVDTGQATG